MKTLVTGDWHLSDESEETVFACLDAMTEYAMHNDVRRFVINGDIYQHRYVVPVRLQNRLLDYLKLLTEEHDRLVDFVPGNHDQESEGGRNALEVLERPGIIVHTEPHFTIGQTFALVWMPYRKNIADYQPLLSQALPARRVGFVHHGLIGARMNTGVIAGERDGIPPAWFSSFDVVFLSHWHMHQQIGNCVYVGSPWQTRADEAGQQKGFVVFDDSTLQWQFVPLNIGRRFWKIGSALDVPVVDVKPGDRVTITEDADDGEALRDTYVALGAEVIWKQKETANPPRFDLGRNATMRDYAAKYVDTNAGDLNAQRLMQVFDEVTS